jgi:hypothetical protein
MQFLRSKEGFPFSSAVIHSGKVFETVLTSQPPGKTTPVPGGPGAWAGNRGLMTKWKIEFIYGIGCLADVPAGGGQHAAANRRASK